MKLNPCRWYFTDQCICLFVLTCGAMMLVMTFAVLPHHAVGYYRPASYSKRIQLDTVWLRTPVSMVGTRR